jgi:Uma2 family endonuclease
MAHRSVRRPVTEQEYLLFEEMSDVRHELVGGEVYPTTGASARHNLIAGNIYRLLHAKGRPHGCRAFISDFKLRVPSGDFYYPDVMLVCDPAGMDDRVAHAPCLVVEVT